MMRARSALKLPDLRCARPAMGSTAAAKQSCGGRRDEEADRRPHRLYGDEHTARDVVHRHQPSGSVLQGGPDGRQASLQDGPPDGGQLM